MINVNPTFSHPPDTKIQTVDIRYTYKCISASAQGRPLSQTRPFVRCSLVCESGVEFELTGKMLQIVLVHNSDTLKDMYCDVCAVY